MSDATSIPGNVPNKATGFVGGVVANVTVLPGAVLTPLTGANAGKAGLALASAFQTACVMGLAVSGAEAGDVTSYQFSNELTLTTAQWDAVNADSSSTGLTPGAYYYASGASAGKMTKTGTGGGGIFSVPIGLALTTTQMQVLPQAPVLTSS